jgi:hypothetical protein
MVKHHLKDQYLLIILFGLIVLSSAMLTGLCLGDRFYLELSPFDSTSDYEYCISKYQLTVYVPLILSTRFALLLLTTIYAYKIRKTPDLFNETGQLVFTIYNLFFLSIALPTIDLTMGRGKDLAMIAYGICIFIICVLTTLIMFVPTLILVMKMDEHKKCSSSTFIFDKENSSSATNGGSSTRSSITTEQYCENTSIIRRKAAFRKSNRGNLYRSHSVPANQLEKRIGAWKILDNIGS